MTPEIFQGTAEKLKVRVDALIALGETPMVVPTTQNGVYLIMDAPSGGGGSTTWGSITGVLSDQTDLQTALNNKLNTGLAVLKSDYTPSHSLLVQQSSTGSPTSLSVSNNTLVGRLSGGGSDIADLSVSQVKSLLNYTPSDIGAQPSLGFTPENVANKENSTMDTSTTKYPTNNLAKTYSDTKIAKHTGVTYSTNAVQTLTAAEYAAIGTPDASTIYFIV